MLKEEFGEKIDFGLKKGEKVKINIGGGLKKETKPTNFSSEKYLLNYKVLLVLISELRQILPPNNLKKNHKAMTIGPTLILVPPIQQANLLNLLRVKVAIQI